MPFISSIILFNCNLSFDATVFTADSNSCRGARQIGQEQINVLAGILKADNEELLTLWLSDQLYNVIEGEPMADEALKLVSKKIKKNR